MQDINVGKTSIACSSTIIPRKVTTKNQTVRTVPIQPLLPHDTGKDVNILALFKQNVSNLYISNTNHHQLYETCT